MEKKHQGPKSESSMHQGSGLGSHSPLPIKTATAPASAHILPLVSSSCCSCDARHAHHCDRLPQTRIQMGVRAALSAEGGRMMHTGAISCRGITKNIVRPGRRPLQVTNGAIRFVANRNDNSPNHINKPKQKKKAPRPGEAGCGGLRGGFGGFWGICLHL